MRVRRVLGGTLLAVVGLLGVLLVRTALFRSRQPQPQAAPPLAGLVEDAAVQRLARAVQFQTVSYPEEDAAGKPMERKLDRAAFAGLREHLRASFPKVHAAASPELFAGDSLLFTLHGSDAALPPVVLLGHMDVVPVEPGTEGRWSAPPFSGAVADGFIVGRGTLDDKSGVVATLEALELLLAQGFKPRRTLYLAFGHDEELVGNGQAALAAAIRARGPAPALAIDEGMSTTVGMVPGIAGPVALIGTAQKGYVSLELAASAAGGHSSMPPPRGAIGALAVALQRLEDDPMPTRFSGAASDTFAWAGPEMAFGLRLVMANRWLLEPVLKSILLGSPPTAALVRTTTAVTMVNAGVKDNVLPTSARATVNFRILPGESVASVIAAVQQRVGPAITVKPVGRPVEPSGTSSADAPAFALVAGALRKVYPEAVVAPALMLGYADAFHYQSMTADIYRFRPMTLRSEDTRRIHGVDERIAIPDYLRHVRFYAQLMQDLQSL